MAPRGDWALFWYFFLLWSSGSSTTRVHRNQNEGLRTIQRKIEVCAHKCSTHIYNTFKKGTFLTDQLIDWITARHLYACMPDRQTDWLMGGSTDEWTGRRYEAQTDGQIDEQTDWLAERICIYIGLSTCIFAILPSFTDCLVLWLERMCSWWLQHWDQKQCMDRRTAGFSLTSR